MSELRNALEAFARRAPAPAPDFREKLWRRIGSHDRAAARRRRRVVTLAAAAAVAAIGATGVLAVTDGRDASVDQTFACSTHGIGGFQVDESVSAHSTSFDLFMGTVWALSNDKPGHTGAIYSAASSCTRTTAHIPLSSHGLRHPNVLTSSARLDDRFSCPVASAVVRLRVAFRAGKPASAAVAVRAKKTGKPLVYIEWKPPRMATFLAAPCQRG